MAASAVVRRPATSAVAAAHGASAPARRAPPRRDAGSEVEAAPERAPRARRAPRLHHVSDGSHHRRVRERRLEPSDVGLGELHVGRHAPPHHRRVQRARAAAARVHLREERGEPRRPRRRPLAPALERGGQSPRAPVARGGAAGRAAWRSASAECSPPRRRASARERARAQRRQQAEVAELRQDVRERRRPDDAALYGVWPVMYGAFGTLCGGSAWARSCCRMACWAR